MSAWLAIVVWIFKHDFSYFIHAVYCFQRIHTCCVQSRFIAFRFNLINQHHLYAVVWTRLIWCNWVQNESSCHSTNATVTCFLLRPLGRGVAGRRSNKCKSSCGVNLWKSSSRHTRWYLIRNKQQFLSLQFYFSSWRMYLYKWKFQYSLRFCNNVNYLDYLLLTFEISVFCLT